MAYFLLSIEKDYTAMIKDEEDTSEDDADEDYVIDMDL
jgi:hypothetical protein